MKKRTQMNFLRKWWKFWSVLAFAGFGWSVMGPTSAQAGFFTMPHFVPQNDYTFGIEPEVVTNDGGSFGVNFRYTHGISEGSNLTGIFGTGSGSKGLRFGGAMTFDVFPDAGNQPGIGFGGQALFVQRGGAASVDATGFAYAHKNFTLKTHYFETIEPFLAVPLGLQFYSSNFRVISSIGVGSIFRHNPHFRSVLELTIGINGSDTMISGGIAYNP